MKAKTIEEAKRLAQAQSQDQNYKDVAIYIIYCHRTDFFYVDTNSLIRLWERLEGYYINGIFISNNNQQKF